jgi:hypothetical protein
MSFGRKKEDEQAAASEASQPAAAAGQKREAKEAPEDLAAPKLSDAELAAAPQHVKDAAAKHGGGVPRAAPKGGEGTLNVPADAAYPDLEPPPPPSEYRAAPTGPSDPPERPKFGEKPSLAQLADPGLRVRARTLDPRSGGLYSGGVRIGAEPVEIAVDEVRQRSAGHLAQLLSDPRIEVELVK